MKLASDMSKEQVLCRADSTGTVLKFVADGLGDSVEEYMPSLAIGIYKSDALIGGVLINDIRPQRDCWLTIYTTTPNWAKRHVLKYVFGVVFGLIGAQRCSVFVSESNKKSLDMCLRLGFVKEGLLRKYRDNGENCYVMGMLKQECKWS
ncbi:MAG: GNAT family N-acetyltransferase [Alphaproteobacteria bacterium]|nr:GNAT family N-acetyltransferase [Alphaproteobacteria bacterium]